MIRVNLNRENFQYDVHSLVKAFYPGEDVLVDCGGVSGRRRQESPLLFVLTVAFSEKDERIVVSVEEGPSMETVCPAGERKEVNNELKRLLYRLLSAYTGRTLPWGDLTGIRPTKIPMTLLKQGWKNSAIANYLRETYYTSNEKTALAISIANREKYLMDRFDERRSKKPGCSHRAFTKGYSLYVGIPFCPSICLYCSFSSSPLSLWKKRVDEYLDTLCYEIERVSALLPDKCPDTVYIGGGTPTTLEPHQLQRLIAKIRECFDLSYVQEFTVEAGRPDSITKEKLEALKAMGVDRVSVNPQTMNQETLDFIGRRHTVGETMEAFALAREAGFTNINMDLIVGLPGEKLPEVEHTMQVLSEMKPDSITVHSLAVKRAARLRLFKEEHKELTFENSSRIMDMAAGYARDLQLHPYYLYRQKNMAGNFENVGYAREGCEGLYNILIMEEMQTIVALGAGAATKFLLPNGQITRVENVKDIKSYLERIDEMIERKKAVLEEEIE